MTVSFQALPLVDSSMFSHIFSKTCDVSMKRHIQRKIILYTNHVSCDNTSDYLLAFANIPQCQLDVNAFRCPIEVFVSYLYHHLSYTFHTIPQFQVDICIETQIFPREDSKMLLSKILKCNMFPIFEVLVKAISLNFRKINAV